MDSSSVKEDTMVNRTPLLIEAYEKAIGAKPQPQVSAPVTVSYPGDTWQPVGPPSKMDWKKYRGAKTGLDESGIPVG